MNKKNILICGATGFIGRNIAERFSKRDDLNIYGTYFNSEPYNNPKINFKKVDLREEKEVKKAVNGMDIIIQMAATTSGAKYIVNTPYVHVTDNALMNSLLLRAAFEEGIEHFIFPSCTVMYPSKETPVKEEDFNREINTIYFGVGWTKVYIEKMCEFFSRLGKTKHTVIRHSNIYGPYDKFDLEKSHVFGATITKVMTAKDEVSIWGTGEEKRDLLYINDLVDFIELAIEKQEKHYRLYNVGLGKAISIKNLVEEIINVSGKDLKIEYDTSKPTIKTSLSLDTTKAKNELGWYPKTSLEKGIKNTMEWYKKTLIPN